MTDAIIASFRRGKTTQTPNQIVAVFKDINKKDKTEKVLGKKVIWKSPAGKEINGVITRPHGNKGAVLVKFEKGLPGQSLGTTIKVL